MKKQYTESFLKAKLEDARAKHVRAARALGDAKTALHKAQIAERNAFDEFTNVEAVIAKN